MARTLQEVEALIQEAVQPGYRDGLLAQGQSRGMIWRDGELPAEAAPYQENLSETLLSFGYALLALGLRHRDLGGSREPARVAFEVAAEALEAVAARGEDSAERSFHRLAAAAAYHLGQFSARAYSLLNREQGSGNLSVTEFALAKLMLRDLDGLAADVEEWLRTITHTDDGLLAALQRADPNPASLEGEDGAAMSAVHSALTSNFMSGIAIALMAFERGDAELLRQASARFATGMGVAAELGWVSQWWCHRLSARVLDDLWGFSFHAVLPRPGPGTENLPLWGDLRELFIASLYRRDKSEIELWPSQIDAAKRALSLDQSLVLSLPTSAGKTRIAELCILACLASKKRVMFLTPLRALSAQTEQSLRRTFGPLGKSVSALYGSIGESGLDTDALNGSDIVVGTPEKLDFALRSDSNLLDDVGLIVLDEGHMIGLGEREVRYEAQIQRLLHRKDAANRRILCLSAILPEGTQLEDFAAWLTADAENGAIKNSWRPTRLRFGQVTWCDGIAKLEITVGEEKPTVKRFLEGALPTSGKRKKLFPSDQRELCIATAWRLVADGQTVLIYCPQRNSVGPIAESIVSLHRQGLVASVLTAPLSSLATALSVGTEWFGLDHPILKCLQLGVAIHHGALPSAYRREVEKLLREGTLKVTVSSPTLAQGLNLGATALVFFGLTRSGKTIDIADFRNVVGRAGRAFVDIEGLVLCPMFDAHHRRKAEWNSLVDSGAGREMESGLLRLIAALLVRIQAKIGTSEAALIEYIAGQAAWEFPALPLEAEGEAEAEEAKWHSHLMSLDTAILSLLADESDVETSEVAGKLDEVLSGSLLERRLRRQNTFIQDVVMRAVKARAARIWERTTAVQRRGYFLAGVGLEAGSALDAQAGTLEGLLLQANLCLSGGQLPSAVEAMVSFAAIAFTFEPFKPKHLPADWQNLLRYWLWGSSLPSIPFADEELIQFIETAFVYNLPWAMEAVRVRAVAHANPFSIDAVLQPPTLSDFPRSFATAAVETGTLSAPASILIQAGFGSRIAAIKAVHDTNADFDSMEDLRLWLRSPEVEKRSLDESWPTPEARALWVQFRSSRGLVASTAWHREAFYSLVTWLSTPPPQGTPLRFGTGARAGLILSADFEVLGRMAWRPKEGAVGLVAATATADPDKFDFTYWGPDDFVPR